MKGTGETGGVVAYDSRLKLERAGRLHSFHWIVIVLSFCLTLFAWRFSSLEHAKRVEQRFDREVEQVLALIDDRMQKYEDALWGGVAFVEALDCEVDYGQWKRYADSIHIEQKYPGINGIGIIHAIAAVDLPAYLAEQRTLRPTYDIHPEHDGDEFYPISYIIPLEGNEKAVGLDMAHETNRFMAAKKARDTGLAQITGPISLVQDAEKTPGFLFYAPYYADGFPETLETRRSSFLGMVYAPFVVKKLMDGVLSRDRRQVGVGISDEGEVLYDENVPGEQFYDADPMFVHTEILSRYGRQWEFDIRSATSFRTAHTTSQPLTILLGGIMIDLMLIGLFVYLTRASRSALQYADLMTEEVERRALDLERLNLELEHTNRELDEFTHIASHDLKEPLRGIRNYSSFLLEDYEDKLDDEGKDKLNTLITLSERLTQFIDDLHHMARLGREELNVTKCDMGALVTEVVSTLKPWLESENAVVEIASDMPSARCNPVYLGQVFRNLIANGIKYNTAEEKKVTVGISYGPDGERSYFVKDNGIGIPEQQYDNVFRIFKRLHARDKFGGGSGSGLTLAKKIVERHDGRIWIESKENRGTVVFFTLNLEGVSK